MRWILVAALALAGCGPAAILEVPADICLHWVGEGPNAEPGDLEGLACRIAEPVRHDLGRAGKEPTVIPDGVPGSPVNDYELRYACVAADTAGRCPSLPAVEAAFDDCLASESGDGCDGGGGSCRIEYVWSICGPDEQAIGACCYSVYVAAFEYNGSNRG